MIRLILAALLILTQTGWSQALAQTPTGERPTEIEIRQHIVAGQKLMREANTMIPIFEFPADGDRERSLAMIASVRASAQANLPKVKALIAEADTIPKLASTGDPDRDEAIAATDQSLKDMLVVLERCLGAVPSLSDAAVAGDVPKLQQLYASYMKDVVKLGAAAVIGIRAAKAEPGSRSKRASIEALALAAEGTQAVTSLEAGVLGDKELGKRLEELAASIRKQLVVVRADPNFSSPGTKQKLLVAFEKTADLFETTSADIRSGAVATGKTGDFLLDLRSFDVGQSFNRAWP